MFDRRTTGASPDNSFSCSMVMLSSPAVLGGDLDRGFVQVLHHVGDGGADVDLGAVVGRDGVDDVFLGRNDRLDFLARDQADLVNGEDVQRVLHRQRDALRLAGDGDDLEAPRQLLRHRRRHVFGDPHLGEVHEVHAPLLAQAAHAVALGDQAHGDQQFADRLLRLELPLLVQGLREMLLRDQAAGHKDVAEGCRLHRGEVSLSVEKKNCFCLSLSAGGTNNCRGAACCAPTRKTDPTAGPSGWRP